MMPLVTLGKPPIGQQQFGLVAKCDIKAGQELFLTMALMELPWLRSDAKKIGVTIDKGTSSK